MALTTEERKDYLQEAREIRARKLDWEANRGMKALIKKAPLYTSSGDLVKDLGGVRQVMEQIAALGLSLTYTNAVKYKIFGGFTAAVLRALIADLTKSKPVLKGYAAYLQSVLDANNLTYLTKSEWKNQSNEDSEDEDDEDWDDEEGDIDF